MKRFRRVINDVFKQLISEFAPELTSQQLKTWSLSNRPLQIPDAIYLKSENLKNSLDTLASILGVAFNDADMNSASESLVQALSELALEKEKADRDVETERSEAESLEDFVLTHAPQHTRLTVPVIVDSVLRHSTELISRCVFFRITQDDPSIDCYLDKLGQSVPLLLLGVSAIIVRPLVPLEQFSSSGDVSQLFTALEQGSGPSSIRFAVDTDFIWIPTEHLDRARAVTASAIDAASTQAHRGDLFRISPELFATAWNFSRNQLSHASFLAECKNLIGDNTDSRTLRYSPVETKAFRDWSTEQVRAYEQFA